MIRITKDKDKTKEKVFVIKKAIPIPFINKLIAYTSIKAIPMKIIKNVFKLKSETLFVLNICMI